MFKARSLFPIILSVIAIFSVVFIYYAVANPMTVLYFDDWRYFGFFESDPVPRFGKYNVTRIFQEYLVPLSGYFSAYVIYPIVGNYLTAASTTLAIFMALSLAILFIAIYRLLQALYENNSACLVMSFITMALFFAMFKQRQDANIHMFFADEYNLYFCYPIINIFNSVLVLVLMRKMIVEKSLSAFPNPSLATGFLLFAIYLGIFSMLYCAAILMAFSISVIGMKFIEVFRTNEKFGKRMKTFCLECVRHYNIALMIIIGVTIAMGLELTSGRSNEDYDVIYRGSVFSIEFLKRIWMAASGYISHVNDVNRYVMLIFLTVFITAGFLFLKKRKNHSNPFINKLAVYALISSIFLVLFYAIIAAKANPSHIHHLKMVYGVFFYFILIIALLSLKIIQEIACSRMVYPIILMILMMIILNSTKWPYAEHQGNDSLKWRLARPYQIEEMPDLTDQLISSLIEADELGYENITIYIPDNYPTALWALQNLSNTLRLHKIISNKIRIVELGHSHNGNILFYEAMKSF